jgi:hypothetical protein
MKNRFKSYLEKVGEDAFDKEPPDFYPHFTWRQKLEGLEANLNRILNGDIMALMDFVYFYEKLGIDNKFIIPWLLLGNNLLQQLEEIKGELYDS